MLYALDFGTSNTVIARREPNGQIKTLSITPNLVFVVNAQTGSVIIGQEVAEDSQRLFRNFKRSIASGVVGFVPELDGVEVTGSQVGVWFLQKVLAGLEDISSLVITVPVNSFATYRQWLLDHVQDLPVSEIRILDESTAAALGYGLTTGDRTILVMDFGGGTVDFSVVQLSLQEVQSQSLIRSLIKWADRATTAKGQPTAKVLAKTGQNLGGMDVDYWLRNYLLNTYGLPAPAISKPLAEELKIRLSQEQVVNFTVADRVISLSRSEFESILAENQLFHRLDQCLADLEEQLHRQDRSFADLSAVLLVGGSAQIPAIPQWLARKFPDLELKTDKPIEAIAHGALTPQWQLEDFLYHSYGIRYWDRRNQCHNWHTIFAQGQTYPTAKPYELVLGASLPNQTHIELVIGEITSADTEIIYQGDQLVSQILTTPIVSAHVLNARPIAQLDPPGTVGVDRIKVSLSIDKQRTLRITVLDLLTKCTLLVNQPVIKLQ
jgi:molecular chaperone DnaK (HSP70)